MTLFRLMALTFLSTLVISIQGCSVFTYPSPQPIYGTQLTTIDPSSISCSNSIRGTRSHIAFSINNKVDFCFTSPLKGFYEYDHLTYGVACAHGPVGGVRGDSSRLIFQVYIRGHDVALGVDQVSGTLNSNGRTSTVQPRVETRKFLDTPQGTTVDGVLKYNVNGKWLTLSQASDYFTRSAYLLSFEFDQTCNPDQQYLLNIKGITVDGNSVLVPTLKFEPYSETIQTFD